MARLGLFTVVRFGNFQMFYYKPIKAIIYCQKLGLKLPVPKTKLEEIEMLKILRATYKHKLELWLGIQRVKNKLRFSNYLFHSHENIIKIEFALY